jgi:1-deoxy-D-xylulose-5-phosphate synthase
MDLYEPEYYVNLHNNCFNQALLPCKYKKQMNVTIGKLLEKIDNPDDLKKLSLDQLNKLAEELRKYIIDVVSVTGGHFAASLGVVELTIAIHYVYNTPYDLLVWDVGHQAYGHKILTGRRDSFLTNRQLNGISGFPKRSESMYDSFGVGHASTSISAALGMAEASRLRGDHTRKHIAIIGDGALTGGMAIEGLNNAGVSEADLLVILNDNRIAIDSNVGVLKQFMLNVTTQPQYNKVRDEIWHLLGKASMFGPKAQELAAKVKNSIKTFIFKQSDLFESMNFRYFGPVDGHDIAYLLRLLKHLRKIPGPKILHVITTKGKGFKPAEIDQTTFHAPGLFDKKTGKIIKTNPEKKTPKYQDVFGLTLLELARKYKNVVGITPAMPTGSSLTFMMKEFPERTFDVGIAEQHAVTFSAGLATQGYKAFCAIYSSFLQRAYDQVIHDVCLQKLPVVFCIDRAGIVGEDGATHHGSFDLSFLRCVPNLVICAPRNEVELRNLMFTAYHYKEGPMAIRYPRGHGVIPDWQKEMIQIPIGKGEILEKGEKLAIISIGHVSNHGTEAIQILQSEGIHISHYDLRFLKPLDEDMLHEAFKSHDCIICIEDNTIIGGLYSALLEFSSRHTYKAKIISMGIPDKFIEQGKVPELQNFCGYHPERIVSTVKKYLKEKE